MQNYESLCNYIIILINLVLAKYIMLYIYIHWISQLKHNLERMGRLGNPFLSERITFPILKGARAQPNGSKSPI